MENITQTWASIDARVPVGVAYEGSGRSGGLVRFAWQSQYEQIVFAVRSFSGNLLASITFSLSASAREVLVWKWYQFLRIASILVCIRMKWCQIKKYDIGHVALNACMY
jgi:hypothetical protein